MSPSFTSYWHYLLRYFHLWGYVLKWPIAFVGGWVAIFYRRWRKTRAETVAQGWPSAEGRIVGGSVAPIPKTRRFHATLQYTYFVQEYRSGEYHHDFGSESEADDFVRQMKDKSVQIRYKESNPDRSVLEERVIGQHFLLSPRFG
jgi:Protein of unknown function (DUF3592)